MLQKRLYETSQQPRHAPTFTVEGYNAHARIYTSAEEDAIEAAASNRGVVRGRQASRVARNSTPAIRVTATTTTTGNTGGSISGGAGGGGGMVSPSGQQLTNGLVGGGFVAEVGTLEGGVGPLAMLNRKLCEPDSDIT